MADFKDRTLLGQKGEQIAASYLRDKGYRILERNYRCKLGEIDLIANKDEYLVFVEVKARYQSKNAISPFLSMTKSKCNRLRTLGKVYLVQHNVKTMQPRFDVIGIVLKKNDEFTLEHIKNAF